MVCQIRNRTTCLILLILACEILAVPATLEEVNAKVENIKSSVVEQGNEIWKRSANTYKASTDWLSDAVGDSTAVVKRTVSAVKDGSDWLSTGYQGAKSYFGSFGKK